jgi:ankyrin repeat protein
MAKAIIARLHCIEHWLEKPKLGSGYSRVDRGADVNARDHDGWTPLHSAAISRSVQAVRLLLEHGADVNACDRWDQTPTEIAMQFGGQEVVELLSEYSSKSVE